MSKKIYHSFIAVTSASSKTATLRLLCHDLQLTQEQLPAIINHLHTQIWIFGFEYKSLQLKKGWIEVIRLCKVCRFHPEKLCLYCDLLYLHKKQRKEGIKEGLLTLKTPTIITYVVYTSGMDFSTIDILFALWL